jgi:hypothetical protein
MASGVVGVLAGLRSCYSVRDSSPSTLAVTAFLALCLVSLAVSNLVVVLAVIGLVRDGQSADVRAIDDEQASSKERVSLGLQVAKKPTAKTFIALFRIQECTLYCANRI